MTARSAPGRCSRRNRAESRGPRTAAGRARSARNALKHGLCVRTVLLDDEDAAALAAFDGATRAELAPEGPFQGELVIRIVGAAWRARRADRLEAALLGRIWRTPKTKRTRETTPDQRVGFPDVTRRRGDPHDHPGWRGPVGMPVGPGSAGGARAKGPPLHRSAGASGGPPAPAGLRGRSG